MSGFGDILQRVENLNARSNAAAQPQVPNGGEKLDLRSIFRASEEIWKRKQLRTDAQWTPRDVVGVKAAGSMARDGATSTGAVSSAAVHEPITAQEPLDTATATAFEDYLKRAQERAKIEAERAFINQHILEQSRLDSSRGALNTSNRQHSATAKSAGGAAAGDTHTSGHLDYTSTIMATHLSRLLANNPRKPIRAAIEAALAEVNEPETTSLWRKVFPICSTSRLGEAAADITSFRSSEEWQRHVLEQSTTLLQQIFKDHMETVVKNNLEIAQRGGVPGTLSLVDAYLNVRRRDRISYQDGYYGSHPVWAVLYFCLRVGDFSAAATVTKQLQSVPNSSMLVSLLMTLPTNTYVEADKRLRLSAEWKHEMPSCRDIYKRAVYAFLLGNECDDVNDTIENWLWSRLMSCRLDPVNGTSHFHKLQATIAVDLGEEYFTSGSGNFIIYFTVLWLTGQIERAIDVLFRADLKHHAVHIAILAYQQKLLVTSEQTSAPILLHNPKDPILCHLNFARLIMLYVKEFELTNIDYALCYCFFLHGIDFESDGSLDGGSMFEACVSRLCYLSGEADRILGRVNERGDRVTGLIDKFEGVVSVVNIISRVARDSDVSGESLIAARLYILAGRVNEAAKLCSKQLASSITNGDRQSSKELADVKEAREMARWIQKRCTNRPELIVDECVLGELNSLVRLHTFFASAAREPHEAVAVMRELEVVPMTHNDLSGRVAGFVLLPDHVKSVLPEIIVALMEALVSLYRDPAVGAKKREEYQLNSSVVLLFVAQINLRFPIHINSKLLHLQSQIC